MKTKNKYRLAVALCLLLGFTLTGITNNVAFSVAGLVIAILLYMKMVNIK